MTKNGLKMGIVSGVLKRQELLPLPDHLSSPLDIWWVRIVYSFLIALSFICMCHEPSISFSRDCLWTFILLSEPSVFFRILIVMTLSNTSFYHAYYRDMLSIKIFQFLNIFMGKCVLFKNTLFLNLSCNF